MVTIFFHGQAFVVLGHDYGTVSGRGLSLPQAAIDDFLSKREFDVTLRIDGDPDRHSRAILTSIAAGQKEFDLRLVAPWSGG